MMPNGSAMSAGQPSSTIVVFTTDNGAEVITFPDGGNTPFKGGKLPKESKRESEIRLQGLRVHRVLRLHERLDDQQANEMNLGV